MSKVFVLDTNKQPLNPIHPGRARMLLSQGEAAVFRRYPFTIILKQTGLPVKVGTGGRTKYNRTIRGLEQTHYYCTHIHKKDGYSYAQ